jgi:hypothetical protein
MQVVTKRGASAGKLTRHLQLGHCEVSFGRRNDPTINSAILTRASWLRAIEDAWFPGVSGRCCQ